MSWFEAKMHMRWAAIADCLEGRDSWATVEDNCKEHIACGT